VGGRGERSLFPLVFIPFPFPRSSWLLQTSTLASVSAPHPRPPPTFSHTKGGVVARSTPTLLSCLCQGLGIKHSWSSNIELMILGGLCGRNSREANSSPCTSLPLPLPFTGLPLTGLLLRLRLRSASVGPGGYGGVTIDIGICAGFAPVSSYCRSRC
jgi:hypothetical protein